jgi:hypothetical protein
MSLFLGLDAVAAPRGDGLRPELRALMTRHAQAADEAAWRAAAVPADSIPTDAPAVFAARHIPVPGL